MAKRINTLSEYVYKKFMEKEVNIAERLKKGMICSSSVENEIILDAIKSIDKLPCQVILGVNFRTYYLKIQSKDLLEREYDDDYIDKVYYYNDIMYYDATKIHDEELEKKEKGLGQKSRRRIIKKDDVDKFISLVITNLKELKFNTFKGVLSKDDISRDIFDCLKCSTIEIEEGQECCVCYERTLNKTWCKHSVCFRCMENIQTHYVKDGSGMMTKICPMCRKNIIFPSEEED